MTANRTTPDIAGISRAVWESTADDLLGAALRHASPAGSLVQLPGPPSASGRWSDGLEGFARTFLLAAFRVRGAGGADPDGVLEHYARGLAAGVDPVHPERWPTIPERRQAVVEAASVAIALSETRPWLWEVLDVTVRDRVVTWFAHIVGTSGYRNNWIWFQNVVEAFLREVGGPWSQADLDRNDELQEALYVGDGWYSDGAGPSGERQSFDYYAGWAWHLYPLLHARIRGTALDARHAERLTAYLEQAQHLVGAAGAPLLQGRSVTYRFAMLAPFWAGAVAGASPLPPGATRDLAGRVLGHFLDAGAVDDRGLLSIGWHGPFPRVRQLYTGAASPYWASKGFAGLLLGADHPEWTAPTPENAVDDSVHVRTLTAPGWIAVDTPADGLVRVLNHGSDGVTAPGGVARADDPFYARLAYSNATAPGLSPEAIAAPLESHTALLDADGAPSHRHAIERVHLDGPVAVSRSRARWLDLPGGADAADSASWASLRTGPRLTTASVVRGVLELRLAWWTSMPTDRHPSAADDLDGVWPVDAGPWRVRMGGWALADAAPARIASVVAGVGVRVTRADGTVSAIRSVTGFETADAAQRRGADPFAAVSVTPWVQTADPVAEGVVVAALVSLSGGADVADVADPPRIAVRGDALEVTWSDGRTDRVPTGGEVRA